MGDLTYMPCEETAVFWSDMVARRMVRGMSESLMSWLCDKKVPSLRDACGMSGWGVIFERSETKGSSLGQSLIYRTESVAMDGEVGPAINLLYQSSSAANALNLMSNRGVNASKDPVWTVARSGIQELKRRVSRRSISRTNPNLRCVQ